MISVQTYFAQVVRALDYDGDGDDDLLALCYGCDQGSTIKAPTRSRIDIPPRYPIQRDESACAGGRP